MSGKTKISWTEDSWNCIYGCTEVSPGCARCYARGMAYRLACMGQVNYKAVTKPTGGWNGEIVCDESALDIPLHWKKSRRIFVNSMSDTFHQKVPFEFIHKIFDITQTKWQHTYQFCTKRPEKMLAFSKECLTDSGERPRHHAGFGWPHDNILLGVTVENQEMTDKRLPIFLQCPGRLFLSIEPLIGPIKLFNVSSFSQIIIGCETGSHRRPCRLEWVKSLIEQIDRTDADVKIHIKALEINGKVEHDIAKFPKWARLRQEPK